MRFHLGSLKGGVEAVKRPFLVCKNWTCNRINSARVGAGGEMGPDPCRPPCVRVHPPDPVSVGVRHAARLCGPAACLPSSVSRWGQKCCPHALSAVTPGAVSSVTLHLLRLPLLGSDGEAAGSPGHAGLVAGTLCLSPVGARPCVGLGRAPAGAAAPHSLRGPGAWGRSPPRGCWRSLGSRGRSESRKRSERGKSFPLFLTFSDQF